MTTSNHTDAIGVEFPLAEQWLVHHVMLDAVGLARVDAEPAGDPPDHVVRIVSKIEAGRVAFTPLELDHVQHACEAYARERSVPETDRALARSVVGRIDEAFAEAAR